MDQSSLRPKTPPVVKNLIIINVVVFFITMGVINLNQADASDIPEFIRPFIDFNPVKLFGLHTWISPDFRPWQFITNMFMHDVVSPFHLLFNMLGLWMFGATLENLWGPKRFLAYYLFTGIGAGIIYCTASYFQVQPVITEGSYYLQYPGYEAFDTFVSNHLPGSFDNEVINKFLQVWYEDPNNPQFILRSQEYVTQVIDIRLNTPAVGASGALFGLLLAYGVNFPNTMILMLIPPMPIKAKYFVVIFGLFELVMGVRNTLDDNVAHFAHLGGIIFGLMIVFFWKKQDRGKNVNPL